MARKVARPCAAFRQAASAPRRLDDKRLSAGQLTAADRRATSSFWSTAWSGESAAASWTSPPPDSGRQRIRRARVRASPSAAHALNAAFSMGRGRQPRPPHRPGQPCLPPPMRAPAPLSHFQQNATAPHADATRREVLLDLLRASGARCRRAGRTVSSAASARRSSLPSAFSASPGYTRAWKLPCPLTPTPAGRTRWLS